MVVRSLSGLLVCAVAIVAAGSAVAQPAKDAKAPPKPAPAAVEPLGVDHYWFYATIVDPIPTAVRDALESAGRSGAFLDKRDAAGVAAFYAERRYAPVWTENGALTEKARTVIARLGEADADGLDARAYPTPPLDLGKAAKAAPADQAAAEVELAKAIVTYARHAYAGRLVPSQVSDNIGYEQHLPDPVAVLNTVSSATDPAAALASFNPPQPEFAALRDKLAELQGKPREAAVPEPVQIPAGPTLKRGASDPRVPLLRARFDLSADAADPDLYDDALFAEVSAFQKSANLPSDGIIGPRTLAALNGTGSKEKKDEVPLILANMERWRWMPRDLGSFYVRVNVPNFDLDVYQDGAVIYNTRIVDGKVTNQTPIFSDTMENIIVNPSWNVPTSIALKEMLPAIRANPNYLRNYEVLARVKGRYRVVNPYFIDWQNVDIRKLQITPAAGRGQCPGADQVHVPQQVLRLPPRHAVEEPLPARQPRIQPWLHARPGADGVRRRGAGPPEERMERGQAPEADRRPRAPG